MPQDVALVGGTLIDGTDAPPIEDAAVLIRGREILAAGPRSSIGIPDGARVYDTRQKTLLPGLIDGHVHLRLFAGRERSDLHMWRAMEK